ncbi:MAG TPA: MarR family transcriptional regulator [Methanospirillum sp.]|uniref:MarR family winged helix-turn-helix transcriptional regulator n=1 Tax=Methanospirillum sp. TaxID=45200 RepID=UPI002BBD80A8|nr:MarR family transcriptional regulator [Methanospirillum sp.]HOJ95237.1 MarR family transcriptional regulator [Methanospirillum sp.]HOL41768.1 MarR family transcriptional regulator [Methanospirillum sp.]HPP77487.1 MarR family transcriptional regulator [Methanospirillum sp.]
MSDSPVPSSLPPGPLFSIINRARVIYLNERLKAFQLSAGQYPVFMCLLKHPGITQEAMARYFHLDKGTIARTVKKMEDAGYISRRVDPDNRRAFRLSLTSTGYKMAQEIMAIDREWEQAVCFQLSAEEKEHLLALLRQVACVSIHTIRELEGEN